MEQIESNQNQKIYLMNHRTHSYLIVKKILEIVLLIVLFVALFILSTVLAKAAPITDQNVENLINEERIQRGITPLKVNSELDSAAFSKSQDMIKHQYFEHYALGLSPWDFITGQGYEYLYAGENLAMDFQTSEGMVNAWMNSKTHRDNILNPDYNEMGIGIVKGTYADNSGTRETTMVTNMFATQKPAVIKIFDSVVSTVKNIF